MLLLPDHAAGEVFLGLERVGPDEGRLTGILNGIDETWDPRTDASLGSAFAADVARETAGV